MHHKDSDEVEMDKCEGLRVKGTTEVISEIDRMLKVNNTVVDNELSGTDLAV